MKISIEQLRIYSLELTGILNKLLKQLDDTATPLKKNDIEDMIVSPANRLFIARIDKRIIGMLTLVVYRIPFAKKGLLEDIVVEEMYRGKGIGTKLIKAAINQARKEGVSCLDFTSRPERVAANRLYEKLGFKKRDTNSYRITF